MFDARFFSGNKPFKLAVSSFLFASSLLVLINAYKYPNISPVDNFEGYLKTVSLAWLAVIFVLFFFIALVFCGRFKKADSWLLLSSMAAFSAVTLGYGGTLSYALGLFTVFAALLYCLVKTEDFSAVKQIPEKYHKAAVIVMFLLMGTFISVTMVCKYLTFCTSTFDMGIFVQMFHSMKTDLSMTTTNERNKFLTHMAIHVSPVYYLILPVYALFPYQQTLLVMQSFIAVSGVFPLWLIAKKYGYSEVSKTAFAIIYLFTSGIVIPLYYDFHENLFLPPLILWLLWAAEREKWVAAYIFAVLVCAVKEDAPLYVMVIGLYLVFQKGKRRYGAGIFTLSAAYFTGALFYLRRFGEGVMTRSRFGYLMTNRETDGFSQLAVNAVRDPVYLIYHMFDKEYIWFFAATLVPLLFIPLISKKPHRFLLVVPYLIMNLVPVYTYAQNINYQYILGPSACLLYLTVINLKDFSVKARRTALSAILICSCMATYTLLSTKINYFGYYTRNTADYNEAAELLNSLPKDAVICADTFLVPHIAQRREIYMLDSKTKPPYYNSDFIIIYSRYPDDWRIAKTHEIIAEGYTFYAGKDGWLEIYVRPEYGNLT